MDSMEELFCPEESNEDIGEAAPAVKELADGEREQREDDGEGEGNVVKVGGEHEVTIDAGGDEVRPRR